MYREHFFFSVALQPNAGHGFLILDVSRSHTMTRHSRQDSSGRVISSSQRSLPDNTQHSQQTNIHAPVGIRTHDLSRRAATDLRLRLRGHWDRHREHIAGQNHEVKTGNKSFEFVEQIKYLGTTLTNQNSNHEQIKRKLNSVNAYFQSVQNFCLPVCYLKH